MSPQIGDSTKAAVDILNFASDAKERLAAAVHALSTAVLLLKMEMPTIEAFLKESYNMDSFGPIVAPSLFNKSERRAVDAVIRPLFEAAVVFVQTHDDQVAKTQAALAKVSA